MATSPTFGWSEPDDTAFVKNGAQAMRTLGDAIDATVKQIVESKYNTPHPFMLMGA